MAPTVRPARAEDDSLLAALDHRAWIPLSSPAPRPPADRPFFARGEDPQQVLVAEQDEALVGWVRVRPPTPLESNSHVRQIAGLGVDPEWRRGGVGRALMIAAERLATRQGATRMTLRVFSPNDVALAFYEELGYEVEGTLRGEFIVDGEEIDDLLMAKRLG